MNLLRTASVGVAAHVLLTLGGETAEASGSAYEALRAVTARDAAFTAKTIAVSGSDGTPQPEKWRVVVSDPLARAGIREFEVANGHILSERAPTGEKAAALEGTPLRVSELNLDSNGAFSVADDFGKREQIGFDSLNYLLRSDPVSGIPVWTVELFDYASTPLVRLQINASNGSIISSNLLSPADAIRGVEVDPDPYRTRDDGGFLGRTGNTLHKVGESTKRGTLRFFGTMQEWFTGRRTIDRNVD